MAYRRRKYRLAKGGMMAIIGRRRQWHGGKENIGVSMKIKRQQRNEKRRRKYQRKRHQRWRQRNNGEISAKMKWQLKSGMAWRRHQ